MREGCQDRQETHGRRTVTGAGALITFYLAVPRDSVTYQLVISLNLLHNLLLVPVSEVINSYRKY